MNLIYSILIAFILDLIFGDPYNFPHPTRFIGKYINFMEASLRKSFKSQSQLKFAGFILMLTTVALTYAITFSLVKLSFGINESVGVLIEGFILYTTFSVKCLKDEAVKIYKALETGNLEKSRLALSYIVGRDTTSLEFKEIIRAVVETVAENTVDGFLSPLFYAAIGGAPLAMAYKAINTLDSMVGYKNDKYINLGYFSAKTDDIANFIPARLSTLFMSIGSLLAGENAIKAFIISIRDRKNHKSPNCAFAEGAVAGALGIQLGGTNVYFGQEVYKPTIGDKLREINNGDILSTCKIMYMTAMSAVITTTALLAIKEFM